jgi:hypothetical protein
MKGASFGNTMIAITHINAIHRLVFLVNGSCTLRALSNCADWNPARAINAFCSCALSCAFCAMMDSTPPMTVDAPIDSSSIGIPMLSP